MSVEPSIEDIFNAQMVGTRGDKIVVLHPRGLFDRRQALVFAAWLVALAEDDEHEFDPILQAVRNT